MVQSERATIIDTYIKNDPEADRHIVQPMELAGQRRDIKVYRLPIELLNYHIRNGRFAAELLEEEVALGRKIVEGPKDLAIIRRLLLEQNKTETEALKQSLKKSGQLQPGVVTYDGYVINGNRRMAVFERLYEEDPLPKYQYLEVARLPSAVDQKALWRIEAGIQLSKEDRLEYGPINERLKLREGIDAGLSKAEISSAVFGRYSESGVSEKLKELELMEEYLAYIDKQKQYRLVETKVTSFVEMRKGREALEDLGKDDGEILAYLKMGFELIRNDSPYADMRALNNIFRDGGEPAKNIITVLSGQKNRSNQVATSTAIEVFETADEIYRAQQYAKMPLKLVKKALNTLQPLKVDDPSLKETATAEALRKLWQRVYKLMKASE